MAEREREPRITVRQLALGEKMGLQKSWDKNIYIKKNTMQFMERVLVINSVTEWMKSGADLGMGMGGAMPP